MSQAKLNAEKGLVGQPIDRVDGRLKVTGGARYAAEFSAPRLTYGVLLQSSVAKGKITKLDTSVAEAAPGVVSVITYKNVLPPAPAKPNPASQGGPPQRPPDAPFREEIKFSGQNVALVVAETLEQAEHGAQLIEVEYQTDKPDVFFEDHLDKAFAPSGSNRPLTSKRGDFEAGQKSAAFHVEAVYRTPVEHHNAMEPHATVALWNDDGLLIYDSTQGVQGSAQTIGKYFGLQPKEVHLIDPFVGGGFGSKGQSWPHSTIAAIAAKMVGRPVKIAITRRQMFTSNGHRPATRQAEVLGADKDGKLVAIQHLAVNHVSASDTFVEPTGSLASMLYSCPNVDIGHQLVRVNVDPPTYMRAPGESSGSFAIETAMDEMAWACGLDPLEFRLRNYAETDESEKKPYSSKSLRECYRQASEAFGWSRRNPEVGKMRNGRWLVGYGMATASYPANCRPASAKAVMTAEGRVRVTCATQDLGTGTYTILTQIAAEELGIDRSLVRVEIGDSLFPMGPGSGGSCSAASVGSSVQETARGLRRALLEMAAATPNSPLTGAAPDAMEVSAGRVSLKSDSHKSLTYSEILRRNNKESIEHQGNTKRSDEASKSHSMHAFGAQFCEVHVDPDLRMIRVARWSGAFAVGKVLNAKTLTSQLHGGIVWGIGMGLLEETILDPNLGRYINTNLAEYHVPVNRDIPPIDIHLIEEQDLLVSPVGVKGAGEIGITGAAAAIGNAVYHATGKRVRDLPITIDKIL